MNIMRKKVWSLEERHRENDVKLTRKRMRTSSSCICNLLFHACNSEPGTKAWHKKLQMQDCC
jgi:hypothetical protein